MQFVFQAPGGQGILGEPANALFKPAPGELVSPYLESRILSGYVAGLSMLVLALQQILLQKTGKSVAYEYVPPGGYVARHGGAPILAHQILRLSVNVVLCIATGLRLSDPTPGNIVVAANAVYATVLSIVMLVRPVSQSRRFSVHATISSLSIFLVYTYRDLWPLLTFTLSPADEKASVWIVIATSWMSGIFLPLSEPYPYIPLDLSAPQPVASPEQTASILSRIFYIFMNPVVIQARQVQHLDTDMLPPRPEMDGIKALETRAYWYFDPFHGSVSGSEPRQVNILWAMMATFRESWALQALLVTSIAVAQLGAPIGTKNLLEYLENGGKDAVVRPWVWIAWIGITPMLHTLFDAQYIYLNTRWMTQNEAVITSVVFNHALRLRVLHKPENAETNGASSSQNKAGKKSGNLLGQLNNLVTADLANISGARDVMSLLIQVPVKVFLSSWFLYAILGNATWVGLAVMLIMLPVPTWTSGLVNGVQKKKMQASDARIQGIKEALNVIRMLKQFGWESEIKRHISKLREEELKWIFWRKLYAVANIWINYTVPHVHMIATFAFYTVVMRRPLSPSTIFSALAAMNLIRDAFIDNIYRLPQLIQAKVSIGRVQAFLNDSELLDNHTMNIGEPHTTVEHSGNIGIGHASFTWSYGSAETEIASQASFRLVIEDPIVFKKGQINLICGSTGSGKTSLLMALLGEMHQLPFSPDSWVNLPRDDGIAYCAQESWIQSMTIRDNILFGSPYDEIRYRKVVDQCGLRHDLSLFEAGDLTEVGEKGLTLSGGQKARVALARAVYSNAAIILLDDIFAALDVHTSAWIVNKCLQGDLIRGRTVLLVTHHAALVAPIAAYVVTFGANGRVASAETMNVQPMSDLDEQVLVGDTVSDSEDIRHQDGETKVSSTTSKLVIAEEVQQGRVSWKAWNLFLTALTSWPILFWISFLLARSAGEGSEVLETWWLGYWASAYEGTNDVNVAYYLSVYTGIIVFGLFASSCALGLFTFATYRAGSIIHDKLMQSLFASTFRWLDSTPTSRIIARCTQDIQSVDGSLGPLINMSLWMLVSATVRLLAIAYSAPIFIIPGIIIALVGGTLGQSFVKAQRPIKSLRSNAKAPVLAGVNGAFEGLVSIRAFGAQSAFTNQCVSNIDNYSHVSMVFWNLNEWIGVRIQLLSAVFTGLLGFYLVYGPDAASRTAAEVGFSLSISVVFSARILAIVKFLNNLQVEGNSLERIQSYIDIDHEPQPREGGKAPAYWPASGSLRVENLSARYSPDGPMVLDNVSFNIISGERIGVVGRTGSGKSTLALSILRCILTGGEVYFDEILTSSLNLDDLRENITIIPQTPELLAGTLRKNLDLFGHHEDDELNAALQAVGLSCQRLEAQGTPFTLESQIAAGGGNLSAGQRQLVALARALVRQSKLLILDEATSAIDHETDAMIQASLRTSVNKDVTVITIAHRLQTILDSDKIMVLDSGKLVEFGSPKELLQNKSSKLHALVDESLDRDHLYRIAGAVRVNKLTA